MAHIVVWIGGVDGSIMLMVQLFRYITNGFINFFGITQPTQRQERQAAWFICGLLALILLGASAIFWILVIAFGHGR